MASSFQPRPATRQSVRLIIGTYGESGSGKTKSSLLLARGIAGPTGKIVLIDTESGRGEFFADEIPGGYDVIPVDEPFTPARIRDAITAAEDAGAAVIIGDSLSHPWEGIGGVLDMAAENEQAGKKGLAVWKTPKLEHAKLVLKLMQCKATMIVCLRAKFKSRQVKNPRGFTEIVKDDHLTPIQAEDFLFELTTHMQINRDHSIIVTKEGRRDLRACLPEDNKSPITIAHGEAIAKWAAGGAKISGPQSQSKTTGADPQIVALKKELWTITMDAHKGDKDAFGQHLWDEAFISDTEDPANLSVDRLREVIAAVKAKGGQS